PGAFDGPPPDCDALWRTTETAWNSRVPNCEGLESAHDVRQSLAVLRGLTAPNGATVAAATSALPEREETGRNDDDRYSVIRDTWYSGRAGSVIEGAEDLFDGSVRWVAERLLEDGPQAKPAYAVDGSDVPPTRHLGLPGYPGGADIVGNQVGS